jgi:transposase
MKHKSKSKQAKPLRRIDVTPEQLAALDERLREQISPEDYELVRAMMETIRVLSQAVDQKSTSIARLLKTMFGSASEKTRKVLEEVLGDRGAPPPEDSAEAPPPEEKKKPKPGHGRNGAGKYTGAKRIPVALESPLTGQLCPACGKGKVYKVAEPEVIVRVVGQAPLTATVWELERVRCNLCGKVFKAPAPPEARGPKYDEGAGAMVALLRYEAGVPHKRLEMLQDGFGIPLSDATQWEIVEAAAAKVHPAFRELRRQGAQGDVIHNDDTPVKVLSLLGERGREARRQALSDASENTPAPPESASSPPDAEPAADAQAPPGAGRGNAKKERTGVQTTAIVSVGGGQTIALYASGPRHAGENLAKLLAERHGEREAAIQMSDALSRNAPKYFQTLVAHCLAHGRRKFVDVVGSFPEECRRVLESLAEVYRNDAHCREHGLSPQERLAYHQEHSGPVLAALEIWMKKQLEERLVEPNSGLGEAIKYMCNHWAELTLFLRVPKAPLDNNICERALKNAIRHRRNSLFYRNEYGAAVGDLFMSLIHTCKLAKVGAFDYLVQLQKNAALVRRQPADWMPWNYQATLAAQQTPLSL